MENSIKTIKNELLGEQYYEIDHKSGLKIFVMPKSDYSGTFAMFGTKYGSVDTCFKKDGEKEYTTVPEGIAHFLEHKLFESEELDAFVRFEKTGANANAFTTFDRTCYLFQCSDNFEKSLEILLDFVTSPYFTEETVQKEQGIIGQEIRMYQDDPDWQVLFSLLKGIYHNNPVKIDIAGTIESISQITAKLLYSCYNTFYNLSNMALAVAGNVDIETVIAIADKVLKEQEPVCFEQIIPEEPETVVNAVEERQMGVDVPKFALGFKEKHDTPSRSAKEIVCTNIALDIIAGKVSPLYEKMLSEGIINSGFGNEYFCGRGFAIPLFIGESKQPHKVRDYIFDRIDEIKKNGISKEDFEVSKKRLYAKEVRSFNDIDDLANNIVECHMNGYNLFSAFEQYKEITVDDIMEIIKKMNKDNSCLSIIR